MRVNGTVLEKEFLPDNFMRQWVHNFTTILAFVKVCYAIMPPPPDSAGLSWHLRGCLGSSSTWSKESHKVAAKLYGHGFTLSQSMPCKAQTH